MGNQNELQVFAPEVIMVLASGVVLSLDAYSEAKELTAFMLNHRDAAREMVMAYMQDTIKSYLIHQHMWIKDELVEIASLKASLQARRGNEEAIARLCDNYIQKLRERQGDFITIRRLPIDDHLNKPFDEIARELGFTGEIIRFESSEEEDDDVFE